jgi:predicted enzyme related to lactoylglutathione lyase
VSYKPWYASHIRIPLRKETIFVDTVKTTKQDAAVKITGMDLAAYLTGDPARSVAFYRDVLGLTPTEVDEHGRGAEFTLADGTTFGVWKPDDGQTSGGVVMFTVADAKAAVEHYRGRGLQLSDTMESPVCHMAFGTDPDGNGFIIHQRKVKD